MTKLGVPLNSGNCEVASPFIWTSKLISFWSARQTLLFADGIPRRADRSIDGHLFDGDAIGHEMPHRVHMGAGVNAEGDSRQIADRSGLHIAGLHHLRYGIVRPVDHSVAHGQADINPFAGH